MASQISVALVGCGGGGLKILQDLLHLQAEVIVVDAVEEHRLQAIKIGAADSVPNMSELPKVQGIIIGALTRNHEEIVDEALAHDVPVLTERPFTTDLEGSTRLAGISPGRLFIMHIMRNHMGVREFASIVKKKEFGEVEWLRITRTSWAPHHHDPDAAWGMLAQNLSIVLEILGEIPQSLFALPEIHEGNVLGFMAVLGEAPRVVIEDSMRYADNRREIRLHCADGIVVLPDMTSGYIEITRDIGMSQQPIPEPERRPYAPEPPLLRELRTFLEHTRNRRKNKPRTTVAEGLAIVQATDQLRKLAGC